MEFSPFPTSVAEVKDRIPYYEEAIAAVQSGELNTEEEVWAEMERVFHLNPGTWEGIAGYDPKEIGCDMFGHVCPVFIAHSPATESKDYRNQSRAIPRQVLLKVIRRDNHICQSCNKHVQDDEIELDHIIPHSKGGPTTVENLRLLCRPCNRKKSDSLEEILRK